MDLEGTKTRIEETRSSIASFVEFLHGLGFSYPLIEETESLLGRLTSHIDALQSGDSVGRLEIELRKTSKTLSELRANLMEYPEPPQDMIAEVDAAQAEVEKNLVRAKLGKRTKSILPLVALGGLAVYAISRR